MQNLLITGGVGFIGANLVHFLSTRYPEYHIVIFDKLTYAGNLDSLSDIDRRQYAFVRGDICDAVAVEEVIRKYDIDTLVNLAAESHVDRVIMNLSPSVRTNKCGINVILEAARKFGLRTHFVTTAQGWARESSSEEINAFMACNPYVAMKKEAELLLRVYVETHGVYATSTRSVNNIGPYQYPEKIVPLFITNAMDNLPLPIYGHGLQRHDYLFVLDHCEAINLILHRGEIGEVYDIGIGCEIANLDMARVILRLLGKSDTLIQHVPDRPGYEWTYSLNLSKIRALGWQPHHTFEQALEKTVKWYVENERWWRKLKSSEEYTEYYRKQYGKSISSK